MQGGNQSRLQLGILIIGIYASFLTWGLVQEPLSTKVFPNSNEQFRFPVFISTIQSAVASVLGLCYLRFTGNYKTYPFKQFVQDSYKYIILLSFTQSLSSPLATYSLKYIPYLTFQLSKTCKLIPVILVHLIIYKTRIPAKKQLIALIVTLGVTVFTLSDSFFLSKSGSKSISTNTFSSSTYLGYILLFSSLICDGLTNATQDSMLQKQPKITGAHLMVICNLAIIFWNSVYLFFFDKNQVEKALEVLNQDHKEISFLLVMYAVCGALGQIFIFQTLSKFGSIVLIMVTVTRKLVSMVLSIVVFGHKLSYIQYLGIVIVFSGITYEAVSKQTSKKKEKVISSDIDKEKKTK